MKSINEVIKQNTFDSSYQKAYINMVYTANFFADKASVLFKRHGLLEQHYNILRIVNGRKGDPMTPGEIIEVMLNKTRDLTRLIAKLTKLELLERQVNPLNRRKVNISITEKGKQLLEKITFEFDAKFYNDPPLTDEEAELLNNLLDKIRT